MNPHLRRNEALIAACAEFDQHKIPYRIEISRHLKVRWAGGLIVVSSTPGSRRCAAATRACVRRILRQQGDRS
jgi:hypothetical protein